MTEPLAVIFDVDGVLVDSYAAHFESWRALARERNCHEMTESEFRATFGRTSREILAELWTDEALSTAQIGEMDDRKEELFREMLRSNFRAMPGARELIVALSDAGFALAAGSSGPPENVRLVLQQIGSQQRFDAVVTGMDVTQGKPHPQVFQLCAQRVHCPPHRCAVIEDASVGIQAANSAGMLSIGLAAPPRTVEEFDKADHVVRSLEELSAGRITQWMQQRRKTERRASSAK